MRIILKETYVLSRHNWICTYFDWCTYYGLGIYLKWCTHYELGVYLGCCYTLGFILEEIHTRTCRIGSYLHVPS
jgi:hypothetical protein